MKKFTLLLLFFVISNISIAKSTKKISDVLKDTTKIAGYFKIHHHKKDEKYYLELKKSDLNKDFLMTASIAEGIGSKGIFAGTMLNTVIVRFRKIGDNIQFIFRDLRHQAKSDKQIQKAVDKAFIDTIRANYKIIASKGGRYIISGNGFFNTDFYQLSGALKRIRGGSLSHNPRLSHVSNIKNFSKNTEIRSYLAYTSRSSAGASNSFEILVHYSFFPFPKNKFKPRKADSRVGYFLTALKDHSSTRNDSGFIRYIKKWNLEKSEKAALQSLPKKPIIYYLSKTIPFKYRKYVREGVLEWNKAFEKIGFIGAVEARIQMDSDKWDPENNDYHTISWIASEKAQYGAIGPSRINPLTGQILDADILFDESRLRGNFKKYLRFFGQKPQAESNHEEHELHENCNVYESLNTQLGLFLLAQKSLKDTVSTPTSTDDKTNTKTETKDKDSKKQQKEDLVKLTKAYEKNQEAFMGQAIKWIIMHEVGHTLGLRHNFKGTTAIPYKFLHDKEYVAKHGLYGSVMDYPGANIAKDPSKQGYYFTPTLGAYDYWAIAYGYSTFAKNESKELSAIASRSTSKELVYATDEDGRGSGTFVDMDPYAHLYDLSDDPLKYSEHMFDIVSASWNEIVSKHSVKGESFDQISEIYFSFVSEYVRRLGQITKFIGGRVFHRLHKGDGDLKPIQVVDFKTQRKALDMLTKYSFQDKYLEVSKELYEHMPAQRWMHWGSSVWGRPIDTDIHRVNLYIQKSPLARLFSPRSLARIINQELLYKGEKDLLTLEDVFQSVLEGVFSEYYESMKNPNYKLSNEFVSSNKRNLQRYFIKRLMDICQDNKELGREIPYDAKTMARHTLKRILFRFDHFKKEVPFHKMDAISKIHTDDTMARIKAFLNASYSNSNY
ncbi:MAG: zinc-dependent metalloprotease [Candidatus Cloacimonetes bacterium]|nr:zinc-dependent metalloprotease [Candidatus Cloacimonadota bacterium]